MVILPVENGATLAQIRRQVEGGGRRRTPPATAPLRCGMAFNCVTAATHVPRRSLYPATPLSKTCRILTPYTGGPHAERKTTARHVVVRRRRPGHGDRRGGADRVSRQRN